MRLLLPLTAILVLGSALPGAAYQAPDSTPADTARAGSGHGQGPAHHAPHGVSYQAGHGDDATVHHRFENPEAWASRFEDPERDAWQRPGQVVKTLATRPDLVVADIGSATGYFPVRFARACPEGRVYGADIEPGMVHYLNDRARTEGIPNLVSILAAADDPHLPEPVDLVFICNTYHHIDGRVDYFQRLKTQLEPGARIAVVDYRPESTMGPPHKLAASVVEEELGRAGYRLLERHTFLPEQYLLVFSPGD